MVQVMSFLWCACLRCEEYCVVYKTEIIFDTLHVSGRNVALKQPTSQSSNYTYSKFVTQGQSSNAVDGDADPELDHFSCAHTTYEFDPWWRVQFNRSYILAWLNIYNRNREAAFSCRLFAVFCVVSLCFCSGVANFIS